MTTYIDRKGYSVHGERGDWCLNITDEHGQTSYVNHYFKQSDALADGKYFAERIANGETSKDIWG